MKRIAALLAAVAALTPAGIVAGATTAEAIGGTLGCVTCNEFLHIEKGLSINRVRAITEAPGHVYFRVPGQTIDKQ